MFLIGVCTAEELKGKLWKRLLSSMKKYPALPKPMVFHPAAISERYILRKALMLYDCVQLHHFLNTRTSETVNSDSIPIGLREELQDGPSASELQPPNSTLSTAGSQTRVRHGAQEEGRADQKS